MASKHKDKKDDLDDRLNNIQSEYNSVPKNIDQYMVNDEDDLPTFGEVELYDYESDIEETKKIGKGLLKNLVDLYLGDAEEIIKHPYIQSRMDEDAEYYSQMKMVQKISEKLLLEQMKQIDIGEVNPKLYEITSKHIGEIRANIKDGRNARLEIETLYKEMRKDLGLNETVSNDKYNINTGGMNGEDDEDVDGQILSTEKLNDQIDKYIKGNSSNNNNSKPNRKKKEKVEEEKVEEEIEEVIEDVDSSESNNTTEQDDTKEDNNNDDDNDNNTGVKDIFSKHMNNKDSDNN